jgi:hypothetical protein
MNQYKQRAVPALLKSSTVQEARVRLINDMVEIEMNGSRVVVPTAESYQRLLKKVAVLEQKLYATDNKANRVARMNNE